MKDCIFCRIAGGDIPSETIYEDDDFKVIMDLAPVSKGHALIIPKEHCKDLTELREDIASKILFLAKRIGESMSKSLGCSGFNLLQNNGLSAGQTVFHFHMHIIPRYGEGASTITWETHSEDAAELKKIAECIKTAI